MIMDLRDCESTIKEIDHVIFKQENSIEEFRSFLGAAISICSRTKWELNDEKFSLWEMDSILPTIDQLRIQQLYMNRINHPLVIPKIIHIRFDCLTILSLQGNKITSIEALMHLRTQQLNIIWLAYNNITTIKSIRKMRMPEIQWISLHNNPIHCFEPLCELMAEHLKNFQSGDLLIRQPTVKKNNVWMKKMQSVAIRIMREN